MKIIAKTIKGSEFIYKKSTAHAVTDKNAVTVCNMLNDLRWQLKDNETWHVYDGGSYELEYTSAFYLKFTLYNGVLKEKVYR